MRVLQAFLLIIVFAYLASLSHHWTHIAAILPGIGVPLAVAVGLLVRGRA